MKSSISSWSMKSSMVGRASTSATATSSALKMVAYSTPMTPAPMTVRLRGRRGISTISSLSKMLVPLNGTPVGAMRAGADGDQDALALEHVDVAVRPR